MKKKIVVFGDLPIATKVCEEVLRYENTEISGVVLTQKGKKIHNDPWDCPVLEEYAKEKNIPIVTFNELLNSNCEYHLGISARFSKIIPKKVINLFSHGIINFHGGLLPKYGGLYSVCHAILHGEKYGGGTIHYIDEGIDTGNIIKRCEVEITDEDTSFSLFQKTQLALLESFKEILPNLLKGENLKSHTKYNKTTYYDKNSLNGQKVVDITKHSVEDIFRIVRAFDFPGHEPAHTIINGNKIYLTTIPFFKDEKKQKNFK